MERYKETRRVTLIGSALDLALGVLKIVVGKFSFSQSLVADGVHSLSDLATDVLVIWAAKEASREPDADHPYGHQRIETVATVALGLLLITVAVAIGWDAANGLIIGQPIRIPTFWALVVAAVSVVSKEAIYRYTMRVADRIGSDLLRSNAWHSRSDAFSSVVVIIGVGGSMIGVYWLDSVAAVIVALMIIHIAAGMIWQSARELIDTGVDAEQLAAISEAARNIEGVTDIHDLRTRRMGSDVLVDGHVLVDSNISVSEGHRIGDAVYHKLATKFENITDITIHVDPEDDAAYQRSSHLPLRSEITKRLRAYWRGIDGADDIERIVLHYIDGRIQVEAWLPMSGFKSVEQVKATAEMLRASCDADEQIERVDILFR
ncbi:cation diffusion facilitator family transporter [Pseudomonadota bacterium]